MKSLSSHETMSALRPEEEQEGTTKLQEALVRCVRCGGFYHIFFPDPDFYKESYDQIMADLNAREKTFKCFRCVAQMDLEEWMV